MEEIDYDKLKKELVAEAKKILKDKFKPKVYPPAREAMESFERKLKNEEKEFNFSVGTLLKYQQFFPERAARVLTLEQIEGLELENIKLIIESYEVKEEELLLAILK